MNLTQDNQQTAFKQIELNGEMQSGVNARDVHRMLEVQSDFSHWINRRIKQGRFEKGFDYEVYVKNDENLKGGRPTNEYVISIDMAKHLGMMEKNDKGHEIRKYFIEQEKNARQMQNGLQVQIAKAWLEIDNLTKALSEAGRFLNIAGKQTKPTMLKKFDDMVKKVQPSLDFDQKGNANNNKKEG